MAELHVMDALREKRLELVGLTSRLEQPLAQHRGNLAHLDVAIRLSVRPQKQSERRIASSGFATWQAVDVQADSF